MLSEAVLFSHIREVIEKYIEKYGEENAPPPWQLFTIANEPGMGNLHMVQKVFEGAFEVKACFRNLGEC